jgi:hypothetical protein
MGKVELVMNEVVGADEGSSGKTCSYCNASEVRITGGSGGEGVAVVLIIIKYPTTINIPFQLNILS